MSQLNLDPFAAKVYWQQEGKEPAWHDLTRSFIEIIARQVHAAKAVIGHIKGFASCGESSLRVNCVSAKLPVDIEGVLFSGTAQMTLNMVVLAYGLNWDDIQTIVVSAIGQVGSTYGCSARLEATRQAHAHHHDRSAQSH